MIYGNTNNSNLSSATVDQRAFCFGQSCCVRHHRFSQGSDIPVALAGEDWLWRQMVLDWQLLFISETFFIMIPQTLNHPLKTKCIDCWIARIFSLAYSGRWLFALVWSGLVFTVVSLFLDVGGDSLAGLFSTGSFCLFSYLCPGPLLPRCFRLSGHGGPLCLHRSYRGLHR